MEEWIRCEFFLGFPASEAFLQQLDNVNPYARELFLQGAEAKSEHYLHRVEIEGKPFVGKYLPTPFPADELDLASDNIYSLLRKLLPSFRREEAPLQLLTLTHEPALDRVSP